MSRTKANSTVKSHLNVITKDTPWNNAGVDKKHIEVLCDYLEKYHDCGELKEIVDAANKLGELASKGDVRVITAVGKLLEDEYEKTESEVRRAGTICLVKVAGRGNKQALDVVCALLRHASANVRITSLDALTRLTQKGDTKVIERVWASQVDAEDQVRIAVMTALPLLTERGDQFVLDRLLELIKTCDANMAKSDDNKSSQDKINLNLICEKAIIALGEVAPIGDAKTVDILLTKVTPNNEFKLRRSATAALGKVAGKGNDRAAKAVFTMIKDSHADVRWGAVCAVVHLVEPGDTIAIKALIEEAKSIETFLRAAAVHALGLLASRNGPGEEAVKAALNDENSQVRWNAKVAMEQICERNGVAVQSQFAGYGGDVREKKSKSWFKMFK